jgi:hypothetical protein
MFGDKDCVKCYGNELSNARNQMNSLFDSIMLSKEFSAQEKLELSQSFSKIIWNLDDLAWTFDPNKEA